MINGEALFAKEETAAIFPAQLKRLTKEKGNQPSKASL